GPTGPSCLCLPDALPIWEAGPARGGARAPRRTQHAGRPGHAAGEEGARGTGRALEGGAGRSLPEGPGAARGRRVDALDQRGQARSEEDTSELQSRFDYVW